MSKFIAINILDKNKQHMAVVNVSTIISLNFSIDKTSLIFLTNDSKYQFNFDDEDICYQHYFSINQCVKFVTKLYLDCGSIIEGFIPYSGESNDN